MKRRRGNERRASDATYCTGWPDMPIFVARKQGHQAVVWGGESSDLGGASAAARNLSKGADLAQYSYSYGFIRSRTCGLPLRTYNY